MVAIDEDGRAAPGATGTPRSHGHSAARRSKRPSSWRSNRAARGREYCWTITPFTCQAVFDRDPSARRATYVDADLFFLDDPRVLLDELDESASTCSSPSTRTRPNYDRSHDSGRFCVQFLTFDRSDKAQDVMRWWQERCLEWCFARYEDGKFGDQVYLDQWPTLFGDRVHIVRQVEKTLAPWNVRHFAQLAGDRLRPFCITSTVCACFRAVAPACLRFIKSAPPGWRSTNSTSRLWLARFRCSIAQAFASPLNLFQENAVAG